MTEQRIKRLKTKIQESRSRLMSSNPFFALLLMYLKFIAVPDMKKMSTNGRCIYFSPDFADKLYPAEMDFILSHQIMHIIYGHIWRQEDLAGDNYHFACDILINRLLEMNGFFEDRYTHLGYLYRAIPSVRMDVSKLTPEEIYDYLPYRLTMFDERTRNRFLADNDSFWDKKNDNGQAGILIVDIPEPEGMLRKKDAPISSAGDTVVAGDDSGDRDLKRVWQTRAAVASKSMPGRVGGNGAGKVPKSIERMINKMKEPTVDWKKILINFIQERTCDYSFSPPDRRYGDTGFFLPDFNEKEYVSREILFMIDTSGSVDDDNLAAAYSEIKEAIEQFNGKLSGRLGFFDTNVKTPLPFESVNDLMRIIPHGGGGTDFSPIFEYVKKHYNHELPVCIVIFTDGCGPYPQESEAMGIPVLWLINNPHITPPWGKIARIMSDTEDEW